jgi:hypothetical protein
VEALNHLLRAAGPRIDAEHLRAIANLPNTIMSLSKGFYMYSRGCGEYSTEDSWHPVDCLEVKRMATEELNRRSGHVQVQALPGGPTTAPKPVPGETER